MPTGLLRDIWIALSSLGDHRHSKLEKLWIRFHNNHTALKDAGLLQPTVTAQTTQNIPGAAIALPPTQQPSLMDPELYGVEKTLWIDHHVERPNFSTMPSLSSLTVLEIDEVQYLEELSVLLARSISTLRELRLGMASTLNIPPSAQHSSNTAPLFTGGVFALLLSKIYEHTKASGVTGLESRNYDIISQKVTKSIDDETSLGAASANPSSATPPMTDMQAKNVSNVGLTSLEDPAVGTLVNRVAGTALDAIDPALFRKDAPEAETGENPGNGVENLSDREAEEMSSMDEVDLPTSDCSNVPATASLLNPTEKLKLEVLEIERLAKLSPDVLRKTIDLTILTSLTLLQCGDCSNLWVRLRNEFAPRITRNPSDRARSIKIAGHRSNLRGKKSSEPLQSNVEYRLRLKRIHTDGVSSDLIQFLKNTLAPDSLEWLFLQDTETFPSPVTLEAIYRGPIRRHRSSLAKVMIDSAYGPPSSRQRNNAARKWMLSRDVLTFITSGNMCRVRELAVALEYKDWHFFLQRLPNIPHLRSLHVPNISEHPYGNSLNVKDFALGAIDVVALRPEVELCYLGIKNKCFEILELKQKDKPKGQASSAVDAASDDETEDGDHHGDDDEDSDDGEAGTATPPDIAPGAMDSDTGSITSEEEDEGPLDAAGTKKIRLKLREILFYDDKISIFKARHGRL